MSSRYWHKRSPRGVIVAILLLLNWAALSAYSIAGRSISHPFLLPSPASAARSADSIKPSSVVAGGALENRIAQALDQIPAYFEPLGQTGGSAEFVSRRSSYSLFIKPAETDLVLKPVSGPKETNDPGTRPDASSLGSRMRSNPSIIRMRLVGGNRRCRPVGLDPLPTKTNYFIGNDPARWRTDVPTYARIREDNVYPGIDQVFYADHQQFEYDFVLKPGANPDSIRILVDGMNRMRIGGDDLILSTASGEVRQARPVAYQEANGIRTEVGAKYELKGRHRVGIKLGRYDRSRPLIIDPALRYSTLFGNGVSIAGKIAVDSSGNAYVTGSANASSFLQTQGAFSAVSGDVPVAFISKLDPSGKTVIYSAMLGGPLPANGFSTAGTGIAIDSDGNAFICGQTGSQQFPVTAGAFQTSNRGQTPDPLSGFVAKLNAAGSALVYSTYLGGVSTDSVSAIAIDATGSAYLTGYGYSPDFPTTAGAFQPNLKSQYGYSTCFVTKLNPTGTGLSYSTFLGGSASEAGYAIAVDAGGNAYVTGSTASPDFPVTPGALESVKPAAPADPTNSIAFVAKLNPAGTSLVYSTFLGHRAGGFAIAVDAQGNAYVTGDEFADVQLPRGPFAVSTDGGGTLKDAYYGLPNKQIITPPALDPSNPATVYVALEYEGLFKTTDRGEIWTRLANGLPTGPYFVASIAVDPVTTSTVYAGISAGLAPGLTGPQPAAGVYKSTDGGNSWSLTSSEPNGFFLTIDPRNPSTIYAAKDGVGPIKSEDSGKTWTVIANGLPHRFGVSGLAIDPGNPSTLYLGNAKGIYKTQDGGSNWTRIESSGAGVSFAVDPANSSVVYALLSQADSASSGDGHGNPHRHIAGTDPPLAAIVKSVDGGANWSSVIQGIPDLLALYGLVIDPLSPSSVYLGTGGGVYRTTDGGRNWNVIPGLGPADARAVLFDTRTEGTIYVGGNMVDLPTTHFFADKLSPDGSALLYSNLITGIGSDSGFGIVVDGSGNAYITGETTSSDFPSVGAFQSSYAGGLDAFVMKLDAGGQVTFSSFLGGSQWDAGVGIAVDGAGNIYVAGTTYSSDFPLVAPLQSKLPSFVGGAAPSSAIITKISTPGPAPKIVSAQKQGKSLWVFGSGFDPGAVIIADGNQLNTVNDSRSPDSTLMSKKGGKAVKAGEPATIQVMNADGMVSNTISFTPGN